jgi:hypothetical protein
MKMGNLMSWLIPGAIFSVTASAVVIIQLPSPTTIHELIQLEPSPITRTTPAQSVKPSAATPEIANKVIKTIKSALIYNLYFISEKAGVFVPRFDD